MAEETPAGMVLSMEVQAQRGSRVAGWESAGKWRRLRAHSQFESSQVKSDEWSATKIHLEQI